MLEHISYNYDSISCKGHMLHALFFLFLSTSLFGLVTIAPIDIGIKPGLSGNISGSLSSKNGNTQKDEYSLGVRAQYDQGSDYVTWGALTYDYGKSNGIKNEDKIYAHLRYIHAIDEQKTWTSEFFIQTERDRFKDINERSLIGAGARLRFLNSDEWGKAYAGAGAMLEKIDYTHPEINPNEKNSRLNSYLAWTQTFPNTTKLSFLGYFQPKISDSSEYVTLQTLELIVPIYGKLNLTLTAKYSYDSLPPVNVKKTDSAYVTSLLWSF